MGVMIRLWSSLLFLPLPPSIIGAEALRRAPPQHPPHRPLLFPSSPLHVPGLSDTDPDVSDPDRDSDSEAPPLVPDVLISTQHEDLQTRAVYRGLSRAQKVGEVIAILKEDLLHGEVLKMGIGIAASALLHRLTSGAHLGDLLGSSAESSTIGGTEEVGVPPEEPSSELIVLFAQDLLKMLTYAPVFFSVYLGRAWLRWQTPRSRLLAENFDKLERDVAESAAVPDPTLEGVGGPVCVVGGIEGRRIGRTGFGAGLSFRRRCGAGTRLLSRDR